MLGKLANNVLKPFGLKISEITDRRDIDLEDDFFMELYEKVRDYTMTSVDDLFALYTALNFITKNNVPGDLVECGVWKGGSAMFMANYLVTKNSLHRKIYLYDTFSGMTAPGPYDFDLNGNSAKSKNVIKWEPSSIAEVRSNMGSTGYPMKNVILVEGDVHNTLRENLPEEISVLRLDTDWYESTKAELEKLYPKLSINGIIILDDHGHWLGARKAAEEYFDKEKAPIFFSKVNYSTRVGIKLTPTSQRKN